MINDVLKDHSTKKKNIEYHVKKKTDILGLNNNNQFCEVYNTIRLTRVTMPVYIIKISSITKVILESATDYRFDQMTNGYLIYPIFLWWLLRAVFIC